MCMTGPLAIRHYLFISLVLLMAGCARMAKAPVTTPVVDHSKAAAAPARVVKQNQGVHLVRKGDTLYSIAWRYGEDYKEVAHWNGIRFPYVIYPGQVIRLKALPGTAVPSPKPIPAPTSARQAAAKQIQIPAERIPIPQQQSVKTADKLVWRWPTTGKLVRLNLPTSEKGLNIAGSMGQEIHAAADGEVVYSGSGLLGYGKLIIIKHNDTYLSAYAHNDRVLIEEGMQVTIGQKIATMGIGNNGKPLLHFEIRKDGKPVDPMLYLPVQRS